MSDDNLDPFMKDLMEIANYVIPTIHTEENVELATRAARSAPAFINLLDSVITMAENGSLERVASIMEKASDPKVLDLLEGALDAIGQVDTSNPRKVGYLGLMKELNNKEVQKTLGILLEVAKRLPSSMD